MSSWLRRMADWVLGRDYAGALSSEMEELYQNRVDRDGKAAAQAWLKRERRRTLGHLVLGFFRRRGLTPPSSPPERSGGGSFISGFRIQARSLARAPMFVTSVVGTLALGIGGITAVFAVVHAVLLNPLPYPDSGELVKISNSARGHSIPFSAVDYLALEDQQTRFQGVAALQITRGTHSTDAGSTRMLVHSASPSLFHLFGMQPALGRLFVPEEGEPGAPAAAVLGWEFWEREFGGDPARLGESVRINGQDIPIVGVLPKRVGPTLEDAEVILPLQLTPPQRKGPFFLQAFGRLGDGIERSAAEAQLAAINERIFPVWQDSWPDRETTWAMVDLKESTVGDVGPSLFIVLGAAVFVLLMVCANAASLLLARLLDRRRELSVRAALGASRGNLMALIMAESGFLVLLGSALGIALAAVGIHLTTTLGAPFIPRTSEIGLTPPVLLFSLAMSVGSFFLFGYLPSLRAPRGQLSQGLREGTVRAGASAWTGKVRSLLVTTQFAVSVPVLVGGGLLVASFLTLTAVNPGFDANRILAVDVSLPNDPDRTGPELIQSWNEVLASIRSIPGVEQAGVGRGRPPADYPFTNNFVLDDQPVAEGETQPSVPWIYASPDYLEALGSLLVAGRMYSPPTDDAPLEVLVDEAFARRFYRGPEDALGRQFVGGGCTGDDCPRTTIIGVLAEMRFTGLEGSNPGIMVLDSDLYPTATPSLIVRATAGTDPAHLATAVREAIWRTRPRAALSRLATGPELLSQDLQVPRYLAALMGSFGAVSLLLAILGIYGVMDYFVRQHRRDMGIRIALGGEPAHVLRMVMKRGMVLVGMGMTVGLLGSLALTRFMESMLHGIEPTDPRVIVGAVTVLAVVAGVACWGPARRASSLSPREVLAEE